MTTLDANRDAKPSAESTPTSTPAPVAEQHSHDAVITEQQVLFGSAAALAPAPKRRWSGLHALFARPEKRSVPKHYPQRFSYIEQAAMSRAMERL